MNTLDIVSEILRREGSKYTNDPSDRGGPTKYGITLSTLTRWRGRPCVAREVETLTEEEARRIYVAMYVEAPGFGRIQNEALRCLMVDCGVNHGPSRAVQWLQQAVGVGQDGILGRETAVAVNSADPRGVFAKVLCTRMRFYEDLDDQPGQARFDMGWTNRCCEFVMMLGAM